jgi:catechol 2,3-dioxygenase-like lactoylglutathione lyase family enzyme
MSTPDVAVLALDHAAIKTSRLEETRAFFVEVLGLKVGPRPAFKFGGYWLYAGGRDLVHLVETGEGKAPSKAASINHFALRVADIEETARALEARGVPFEREDTPGGELSQVYVTDPNGVRIELNAPGPEA